MYIDDDFCQGMGANMELLPPPDFFGSIDFDFMSAEIFHEHDISDNTDELNTTINASNQTMEVDTIEKEEID